MNTPMHGYGQKLNDTADSETQKKTWEPFIRVGLITAAATVVLIPIGWIYIPMLQAESYRLVEERVVNPAMRFPNNGFDLENAQIPLESIRRGGPPRDGIPAIDEPKFTSAYEAAWLRPQDRVLGLFINGEARAYPQRILVWHELVNDTIGGVPVVVSYCPLCGTSMVFERTLGGNELDFGVSGLLYNSDVLMYDRQTESLWSQIKMAAVSGKMAGTHLTLLASEETTWAAWLAAHPGTAVLSRETGNARNYNGSPYRDYFSSPRTMFPVSFSRRELEKKDWVFGLIVGGRAKAYALDALSANPLEDEINGIPIRLTFDPKSQWARAQNAATGEQIPVVRSYWFAWQVFYPDTELYR